MKKIYIVITALALSAGSFAQTADSLLRRQMELERDFNPTLSDADKINSLPALREPTVRKANTNYSSWAGRITPPLEIALPRPGDNMTAIPFSLKKGYLSFNAGNHANLDGTFGYRLVENERNDLTLTLLHNSTNGDINYVQNVEPASNRAFFSDNEGRLGYRRRTNALTLDLGLSYLHSLFNYYGSGFGGEPLYEDKNQRVGVLNVKAGVTSRETDRLNYKGYVDFRNFSTKFGNPQGMNGNEIDAMAGFYNLIGDTQNKLGIDGKIFSTFYGSGLSDYFLVNAAPYVVFGSPTGSHARLGADALFLLSGQTKIRVAPNVTLQWAVGDHSSLYANIRGGFGNNTFLQMMRESRYVRPYGSVAPSYSTFDVDAGAKIGEISGFRLDVFGGFKKTDDEHFLIPAEGEALAPVYGNLSHAHIGGAIQCNIWSPLDVAVRVKKNFYSMDIYIENPKAYNKPGLEVDLRATLSLTDYLNLTASYYFADDRWSYYDRANRKMNNINDLNAGALYRINDAFSINVRANNLLSQKYDIWYGYPAQGINASGGFTFRF
jgi:hypothetical protein